MADLLPGLIPIPQLGGQGLALGANDAGVLLQHEGFFGQATRASAARSSSRASGDGVATQDAALDGGEVVVVVNLFAAELAGAVPVCPLADRDRRAFEAGGGLPGGRWVYALTSAFFVIMHIGCSFGHVRRDDRAKADLHSQRRQANAR